MKLEMKLSIFDDHHRVLITRLRDAGVQLKSRPIDKRNGLYEFYLPFASKDLDTAEEVLNKTFEIYPELKEIDMSIRGYNNKI